MAVCASGKVKPPGDDAQYTTYLQYERHYLIHLHSNADRSPRYFGDRLVRYFQIRAPRGTIFSPLQVSNQGEIPTDSSFDKQ